MFMKILIILLFLCSNAFSNDAVSSQTLKGIVLSKTDAIALRKEKLLLTPKEITVDYIFENTTSKAQTLLVSFPLPPLDDDSCAPDRTSRFDDFSVTVDGANVSYQTECRAFNESIEVTEDLKKVGLPICEFNDKFDRNKITKDALAEMTKKNLLNEPNHKCSIFPFKIHRKHYWTQNFPPMQKIHVQHKYRPELGSTSVCTLNNYWDSIIPNFPGPREDGESPFLYCAYYLEYIITSANTWKNGIEDFEMIATGANLILGKVDGERDADVNELKFTKKNFSPKNEILIEFVQSQGPDSLLPKEIPFIRSVDGPANCRETPKGKIVSSIPDLAKVNIRERKEDWYRVEFNGKECWTIRNNLRFNFNR